MAEFEFDWEIFAEWPLNPQGLNDHTATVIPEQTGSWLIPRNQSPSHNTLNKDRFELVTEDSSSPENRGILAEEVAQSYGICAPIQRFVPTTCNS